MTEPIAQRRAFAARYVADEVLDPAASDVVNAILAFTGGHGVDVAFEAAGAAETPQQAAAVTRPGGRVIVAGIPKDDVMEMKASTSRMKGLTIKLVRRMKHTYPRAIRLVESGVVELKPLATHFLPLSRVAQAFELVSRRQDGVLRAMVQMENG
jgi:L-iditol 2-dehydrogenase